MKEYQKPFIVVNTFMINNKKREKELVEAGVKEQQGEDLYGDVITDCRCSGTSTHSNERQ